MRRTALSQWIMLLGFGLLFTGLCLALGCARAPAPGDPLRGLSRLERDEFERGRRVFEQSFTAAQGLGPLFNADACVACHDSPTTGGAGEEFELHAATTLGALDLAATDGGSLLDAAVVCDLLQNRGGPVFQTQVTDALRAATGLESEPLPPGVTVAQRTAPDVFGFGLIDAVPDEAILAHADPEDADGDGISGRPSRFFDGRLGRFGRKALLPSLLQFNTGAFLIEQGITVPGSLQENSLGGRPLPPGVDPLPEPELDAESVRLANQFVRFLAPPSRQLPDAKRTRGERIFRSIRCDACHVPSLRTGPSDVRALSHRRVAAYTDLLLHDMGPNLADICFGEATPAEFRTEPLMGLRFATRFLHDGRATTIEEAIRLHDGEAAASRDRFVGLSDADRAALIAFLKSL
jgi:CxxC motif-containing protein (DUF1111 family)